MNEQEDLYSISAVEANVKSLLIVFPMAVLSLAIYRFAWGWEKMVADLVFLNEHLFIAILILIGGICLHELLHGFTWIIAAGLNHKDIDYGFKLYAFAPYAHCTKAITARAYRIGVLAPGLVLGLIPFAVGLVTGVASIIWFGFIFTLAAGGDFLMLWIIRDLPGTQKVEDHPERVGCKVV